MVTLYCDFADAGRAPLSATFMCDERSLGHARSGMAKLASRVGWSCGYHELTFGGGWPDGRTRGKDCVLVTTFFDPDSDVTHPETGEPVLPPYCHTAICRAAYEGDVIGAFDRLFRSRGWVGETTSVRL